MKEFTQWVKLPVMAQLLSRSVKQFRADVEKYHTPHIKLGRDKLFDPEKVIQFLLDKSQTAPPAQIISAQPAWADSSAKKHRKIESETVKTNRFKSLLGLA